jgi:aminomethyltransferase
MKRTVLYGRHVALNAKIAEFGGYDMPIQYEGIVREHQAARAGAAIFDTCHMGEFMVRGAGAVAGLERLLSCDVADIRAGTCRYGFICNEAGGVVDDLIVYRMGESEFMMVVNSATEEGDFEWAKAHLPASASLENISRATAKIDVQGPASPKIVAPLMKNPLSGLKYYNFAVNSYKGAEVVVSRTGYTGEIGFEVYCPADAAVDFWNDCVERGAAPAGLGARDVLRLEMGFPLYGHELSADRNAAQSATPRGLSRNKEFIGSASALNPQAASQLLCGIAIDGRRSARHGDTVLSADGREAGVITSGSFAPSLGFAVALGYIDKEYSAVNTELRIVNGKTEIPAKISPLPFYKNATARADINLYL